MLTPPTRINAMCLGLAQSRLCPVYPSLDVRPPPRPSRRCNAPCRRVWRAATCTPHGRLHCTFDSTSLRPWADIALKPNRTRARTCFTIHSQHFITGIFMHTFFTGMSTHSRDSGAHVLSRPRPQDLAALMSRALAAWRLKCRWRLTCQKVMVAENVSIRATEILDSFMI